MIKYSDLGCKSWATFKSSQLLHPKCAIKTRRTRFIHILKKQYKISLTRYFKHNKNIKQQNRIRYFKKCLHTTLKSWIKL